MKINILVEKIYQETLIIPIIQDETTPARLKKIAHKFSLNAGFINDFSGKYKEILVLYPPNTSPSKIFLIGLGDKPTFRQCREALRSFAFHSKDKLSENISIDARRLSSFQTEAIVNGLELSDYNIHLHHTDTKKSHPLTKAIVNILISKKESIKNFKNACIKGIATGQSQKEAMTLVNQDAHHMNPAGMAKWVRQSSQKYGYKVQILDKQQCEELGLKAFLAVNRGSEFPPYFIIAEYIPLEKKAVKKIGLVGKGVTFDTGGLNIKTGGMHYMKSDMGGAAAVLGAMELTAKLKLPVHLITIVPATDNCVDALAVRPSDVIGSYSGKTIEIIDTDAEGRLTLADGVSYMEKNFQPDVMIDAATLTGSSVRALGYHAGALFSNNAELASQLKSVGERTGERLWELPLYDEFKKELKSDVADIANLGSLPMAGASTAAKFIEYFINDHPTWAHLDIAGVAFGNSEYSSKKAGTAFGVNLLVEFIKEYSI